MTALLWTALALAAPAPTVTGPDADAVLVVDAKLPAELLMDGHKLVQLFVAGEVHLPVHSGEHEVRVLVGGEPQSLQIEIPKDGRTRLLVGRTGSTSDSPATVAEVAVDIDPDAPTPVEFRVTGPTQVQLRIDDSRHMLDSGGRVSVDLERGAHQVSIRNGAGTVIWASGTLEISGTEPVVVQLTEGRMPEISGQGAFHAQGG